MTKGYRITKILSNNVVISEKDGKLYVLIGKGIGFGKKSGNFITNEREIEQKFASIHEEDADNYNRILNEVDRSVVAVSEEIIALAASKFNSELDPHIHVGLTDHIDFALKRVKDGIAIGNPFQFEIKAMYPEEYTLAEYSLELIEQRLGVRLPESEIGFIALHFHSARVNHSLGDSIMYTRLVKDIVEMIERETGVTIEEKSLDYGRLMSHLKYSMYRIVSGKTLENVLLSSIKRKLKDEYKLAKRVCDFMGQKLEKEVPEDEVGYIAVHLGRLKSDINQR